MTATLGERYRFPRVPIDHSAAERVADDLSLSRIREVVRVDQGRLGVPVSHPLLQRPHRDVTRLGDVRAKRVAQVMKPDDTDTGATAGRLEPLENLASVER